MKLICEACQAEGQAVLAPSSCGCYYILECPCGTSTFHDCKWWERLKQIFN